jgi:hypothetical protein
MEWDDQKRKVLNRVGLLCLALTSDYRRENYWRIDRIEATEGVTLETKFKRRELDNNLDIGLFVIDCEKRNKKYFKVSMTYLLVLFGMVVLKLLIHMVAVDQVLYHGVDLLALVADLFLIGTIL